MTLAVVEADLVDLLLGRAFRNDSDKRKPEKSREVCFGTAVLPEDASMMVLPSNIDPLQIP